MGQGAAPPRFPAAWRWKRRTLGSQTRNGRLAAMYWISTRVVATGTSPCRRKGTSNGRTVLKACPERSTWMSWKLLLLEEESARAAIVEEKREASPRVAARARCRRKAAGGDWKQCGDIVNPPRRSPPPGGLRRPQRSGAAGVHARTSVAQSIPNGVGGPPPT